MTENRISAGSAVELALGLIVFGPAAATLEGKAHAIEKLRQAAVLLEYLYAEQRKAEQCEERAGEVLYGMTFTASAVQAAAATEAPKKRRHRKSANGAAREAAALSAENGPLFPQGDVPEAA